MTAAVIVLAISLSVMAFIASTTVYLAAFWYQKAKELGYKGGRISQESKK